MEVTHEEHGQVDLFRISGRLDYTASAGDFEKRLRAPLERDPLRRFPVIDLFGVTMLGSQALRAILALAKDLQGQSGRVYVCAPSDAAREALKVSGFLQLKIFELHEAQKSALTAAALEARDAPPLKNDDPWIMPPPEPEPPLPPTRGEVAWEVTKKSASALGRAWQQGAGLIQKLLDKRAKK